MTLNDTTLGLAVRRHTGLDSSIVSDSDLQAFISDAKAEIEAEVGTAVDFYATTDGERALLWLTCILVLGSMSAVEFAVGELEFRGSENALSDWEQRYSNHLDGLVGGSSGALLGGPTRSDRTYEYRERSE